MAVPIAAGFIIGKLFIYFVSWDRCDFCTIISVSLFVSYATLYSVEVFLGASGILTLLVFGVIICCNKRHITADLEHSLVEFWELLYNLFNFVLYIEAGILLVHSSRYHGEGSDVVRIFITYLMCIITRSLMLLILSPILTRIGYGLNWKNGAVLVWGALKGTATILLASCVYLDSEILGDFSHKVLIYAVGLVLLQLIINGTTLKKTVQFLGFTTVSVIKISNMNNIILYVMLARDRSINMLKMNRFFADAAWDAVRRATKIVHPYKDSFKEEGKLTEGDKRVSNYSKCPDCDKEVPVQPTPKELQEIKREAYLRILKAKKVSYWRQFEWGLLTKEANRTLVGAVENAVEKNANNIDIDALRNCWKPKGCTVYVRNTLVKLMPKDRPTSHLKAPLTRWKLRLYEVVTNIWWEYGTFLLVILHAVSIILDFVYRPEFETVSESVLMTFSTALFAVLTVQSLIVVIGLGCYNFMRSIWYLIDVLLIVISFFYLFYMFKHFIVTSDRHETHVILISLSASRVIYAVRLWRIFYVIQATIPKIVEHLDRKIDIQLAHGFDVGKGFVTGENEILKLLPRFVGDKSILTEIKVRMEEDRLAVTKEIGILQRNRPSIAITVKTREAVAAVLHIMRETAKELKDGGLLDDEEYHLLRKAIHERQKFAGKNFLSVSPRSPDVLFRSVAWLADDEETANFLMTHSLMVNLNYEEILIKTDEEPQGIYIIVSGLVRMSYKPNLKKLKGLENCGALPNVDYPMDANFRESQEDYIVSGNVMGEIGILTGRTYDTNITCESSVQAYFISIDVMNYVIKTQSGIHNGLEQRIWKAVAVRLACIILPAVPTYQSWSQEKIQIHLERAFVPKLGNRKEFILSDVIEAVILIEGKALDVVNKDLYFAPSYIPRTVRKLTFFGNETLDSCYAEPILLIIPAQDIDDEQLMEHIERGSALATVSSMNLLRRTSLSGTKSFRKPLKRIRRNLLGLPDDVGEYSGGVRSMKTSSYVDIPRPEKERAAVHDGNLQVPPTAEDEMGVDADMSTRSFGGGMEKKLSPEDTTEGQTDASSLDEGSSQSRESMKSDGGLYSLSYFNYKPLYDADLDELRLKTISASAEALSLRSVVDERNQGRRRLRMRKSKPKVSQTTAGSGSADDTSQKSFRSEEDGNVDRHAGTSKSSADKS